MINSVFSSFTHGLLLNLSIIVAVGAQNTFILTRGLKREKLFLSVFLSSVFNIPLVVIGVYGIGLLITNSPIISKLMLYISITYLFIYGVLSFISAFKHKILTEAVTCPNHNNFGFYKLIVCVIAFSWLNPHALLDSFVIVGGIGAQLPNVYKLYFTIGACLAEFVWLFSLGYGAFFLAPMLKKPKVWTVIDICIALLMWFIAIKILLNSYN